MQLKGQGYRVARGAGLGGNNGRLLPGQFVTMMIAEKDLTELPVVPQTAVLQDREGRYVFVVKDDNTVAQTRITTGPRVETGWAVSA